MSVPVLNRNDGTQTVAQRLLTVQTYAAPMVQQPQTVPALDRNCMTLTSAMTDRSLHIAPVDCCDGDGGGATEYTPNSFEGYSANLNSSGAVFGYAGGDLVSVNYADGVSKMLTYGPDGLASVTLIVDGVTMVKTLTYTGGALTAVSYS